MKRILSGMSVPRIAADPVPAGSVKCARCHVTVEISKISLPSRCLDPACPLNDEPINLLNAG